MTAWLLPLLAGFGTGILSAWGVGGGTLLLLVMTLFLGVNQTTAQGINLLYFLPTAGVALLSHRKNGLLEKDVVKAAVPTGLAAAAAAAWVATAVDVAVLRKPFGLFLLYSGMMMLRQSGKQKK
ncbi:MAG: TSUP family transporter [Oscillospiraceae bacterium]|nr:TSUP family transporter [Oscillospiraceae bacterium]